MRRISITPIRLTAVLASTLIILLLGHFFGLLLRFGFDIDRNHNLVQLFDLRIEKNLPTYYSTFLLLLSALFLLVIASHAWRYQHRFALRWFLLSLLFLFLSWDEYMEIHERLERPVRDFLGTTGILYFAWVIPYTALLIALVIIYSAFLRALPSRIRYQFVAAGLIFIAGAIGFESLSGAVYYRTQSFDDPYFILWFTLEETFEMSGVVLFIHGLSLYIVDEMDGLEISILGEA